MHFRQFGIKLWMCGYVSLDKWHCKPGDWDASQPCWRLYWNGTPGMTLRLRDSCFRLGPEHLCLIAPNSAFEGEVDPAVRDGTGRWASWIGSREREQALLSAGTLTSFFVHFTLDAISAGQQDAPAIYLLDMVPGDSARLRNLLRQVFEHREESDEAWDGLPFQAFIMDALSRLPEEIWHRPTIPDGIQRTLDYIEDHLADNLENAALARRAYMAPKTFMRWFKACVGCTPRIHVLARRMERAAMWLGHTDLSMEDIAEGCGYADRFTFSKVFAKHMGLSPAKYRRECRFADSGLPQSLVSRNRSANTS